MLNAASVRTWLALLCVAPVGCGGNVDAAGPSSRIDAGPLDASATIDSAATTDAIVANEDAAELRDATPAVDTSADGGEGGEAPSCSLELPFGCHCGFEQACDALGCGAPGSRFNAQGSLRRFCSSNDECSSRHCVPVVLYELCASSTPEGCNLEDGGCSCTGSADCGDFAQCLTLEELAQSEPCDLGNHDCGSLELYADVLQGQIDNAPAPDLAEQLQRCAARVAETRLTLSCI